jgi:hypothetical protein
MGTGGNTASGQDGCLMHTLQQVLSTVDDWRVQQRREVTYEVRAGFIDVLISNRRVVRSPHAENPENQHTSE